MCVCVLDGSDRGRPVQSPQRDRRRLSRLVGRIGRRSHGPGVARDTLSQKPGHRGPDRLRHRQAQVGTRHADTAQPAQTQSVNGRRSLIPTDSTKTVRLGSF